MTCPHQKYTKDTKYKSKKGKIEELTNLYIPEMTGLRNPSKQKKQTNYIENLK